YALGPARQSLTHLRPLPPFYWPPGYPLAVALTSFVAGARPLPGQLVSLVAGGLAAVFTLLLARELWPTSDMVALPAWGPALAGLVVACGGQLWQSSAVVMADTLALAAATAGVWALARYGRREQGRWLALAATGLAVAVVTRWAYALVALPCALSALTALVRRPRPLAVRDSLAALAVVVAILGPIAGPALAGLVQHAALAPFATDLQVYSWQPLNAFRRTFATADGQLAYALPNGLYYASLPARPAYLTPLLAWLILPGLWLLARRRDLALWLLLAGWAASVFAFHAGAPWQNVRFGLAYLPPLAILSTLSFAELWVRANATGRAVLGLLLAAGLAWQVASGTLLLDDFIARKDADLALVRAVNVPPDAQLLTFGPTLTFQHYTALATTDLSEVGPRDLARLLAGQRPTYLLLDVPNVESQWRGLPPDSNYQWLRAGPGLRPLRQYGPYTLFQVGTAPPGTP
ncbi:MAG TPA: hypothetical protein VFU72_03610, partial [Nitrolancea sp.]|nr:hypothetical protein [Nitrolancea sp.]